MNTVIIASETWYLATPMLRNPDEQIIRYADVRVERVLLLIM